MSQRNSKLPRTYVIEEDKHLQNLRKIIKRDFFESVEKQTIQMPLNQYLSNFKSNENNLFSELVHRNKQQWQKQHWWVNKQDQLSILQNQDNKPYHNMICKDPQINSINHVLISTKSNNNPNKKKYLIQSNEKNQKNIPIIQYQNCSLNIDTQFDKKIQKDDINSQIGKNNNNSIIDNNNLVPQDLPLMTWGQIQNTPIRIQKSQYRIPDTPNKDDILNGLNSKINKRKLQKNNRKSQLVMRIMASITPSRNPQRSSIKRICSTKRTNQQNKDINMQGLLKMPN